MIFPGWSVAKHVRKYPALQEALPLCDCPKPDLRPYITQKCAGIECGACGTGVWQKSKPEDNQRMLNLFTGTL